MNLYNNISRLCLVLILINANCAQASLQSSNGSPAKSTSITSTEKLASLEYMKVLPRLRTMLGQRGAEDLSKFNVAYNEIKKSHVGDTEITVGQVIEKYRESHPEMQTADAFLLFAGCVVLFVGGVAIALDNAKKIQEIKQHQAQCKEKRTLQLIRSVGLQHHATLNRTSVSN